MFPVLLARFNAAILASFREDMESRRLHWSIILGNVVFCSVLCTLYYSKFVFQLLLLCSVPRDSREINYYRCRRYWRINVPFRIFMGCRKENFCITIFASESRIFLIFFRNWRIVNSSFKSISEIQTYVIRNRMHKHYRFSFAIGTCIYIKVNTSGFLIFFLVKICRDIRKTSCTMFLFILVYLRSR